MTNTFLGKITIFELADYSVMPDDSSLHSAERRITERVRKASHVAMVPQGPLRLRIGW